MNQVIVREQIPASADDVWGIVGGFNDLPKWVPAIATSKANGTAAGAIRTLKLVNGFTVKQRLDEIDYVAHRSVCSIIESSLPISRHQATIKLADAGEAICTITWSCKFAADGAPEPEVADIFEGMYRDGIAHLKNLMHP